MLSDTDQLLHVATRGRIKVTATSVQKHCGTSFSEIAGDPEHFHLTLIGVVLKISVKSGSHWNSINRCRLLKS